jgi:hypothetical protein
MDPERARNGARPHLRARCISGLTVYGSERRSACDAPVFFTRDPAVFHVLRCTSVPFGNL